MPCCEGHIYRRSVVPSSRRLLLRYFTRVDIVYWEVDLKRMPVKCCGPRGSWLDFSMVVVRGTSRRGRLQDQDLLGDQTYATREGICSMPLVAL